MDRLLHPTVPAFHEHVAMLACLALLGACGHPPPVGYDGPLPSPEARVACLRPIMGHSFHDETGALGGGELVVAAFAVGARPLVRLDRDAGSGGGSVYLPVYTDGDVADLYRRVTGERSARFEGALSAAYRQALGL